MTRETKIGLLVGLAFIIVIGILLSDHLTSSTEPIQAALGGAGNSAREALGSPGANSASAPITVVTPVVTPQQPVATQAEVTTPTAAVQIVKIGGPVTAAPQPSPEMANSVEEAKAKATDTVASAPGMWQFLYFLPLPQGHKSLRPKPISFMGRKAWESGDEAAITREA